MIVWKWWCYVKKSKEKAKEDIRIIYKGLKSKEEIKLIQKSDFILTIPTDDEIGFLDSNQIEKCYKCGYKTAMEKMDEIHKILSE